MIWFTSKGNTLVVNQIESDLRRTNMKYGLILGTVLALGLNSAALKAQSAPSQSQPTTTAVSGSTNAPASALTLAPSILTGVKTTNSGQVSGGGDEGTFGPFVRPSVAAKYADQKIKLGLSYEFETSAGRGFADSKVGLSDTAYFKHNPVLSFSGNVQPNWKINSTLDMLWDLRAGDQKENRSEIYANPEIERVITPRVSLSVGYVLHRITNFDSTLVREAGDKSGLKAAVNTASIGQEPQTTLHAGIITNRIDLAEGTKLTTYVRAGKKIGNTAGATAYAYRFQTHLNLATPVKGLSAVARYRLNVEDVKNAKINYYNLARVELAYELSSNWSLNLENEFIAAQSTKAGSKAQYENENYAGVTYSF